MNLTLTLSLTVPDAGDPIRMRGPLGFEANAGDRVSANALKRIIVNGVVLNLGACLSGGHQIKVAAGEITSDS